MGAGLGREEGARNDSEGVGVREGKGRGGIGEEGGGEGGGGLVTKVVFREVFFFRFFFTVFVLRNGPLIRLLISLPIVIALGAGDELFENWRIIWCSFLSALCIYLF